MAPKSRRSRGRKTPSDQVAVSRFAGDAYSLATRAISGVKKIARLINIETKVYTQYFSFTPSSTPTVVYLSALTQGVTNGVRIGNSFRLQRLYWRYFISSNPAATTDAQCRVMIIRDNECQGAIPTPDDVLVDVSTGANATLSPVDINNAKRFAVLQDEVHILGGTTFQTTGSIIHTTTMAHDGHIKYRGTDATPGSAAEGSIFFLTCSPFASNLPSGVFYFTLWYTDD
jgi:hypothetical protein